MSTYPNLSKDPKVLKIKTKDDQLRELQNKTEKHDYEKVLKSPKIDNEYYKIKYKSLIKKCIYDCFRNFSRLCWIRCP